MSTTFDATTLKRLRRDIGLTFTVAASTCGITPAAYLDVERGDATEESARYVLLLTAAHGEPCPRCGVKAARFISECATDSTPAFLHCGCAAVKVSR